MSATRDRSDRWHRYWDKHSGTYDRQMQVMDRVVFGDSRTWACSKASGKALEVAVGTGLNLPHYPEAVALTGIDLSEEMLAIARARAAELGRTATLQQANAHALPFTDATFDTVVCTFGLCAIPDTDRAIAEMNRVLRPGGAADPGRPRRQLCAAGPRGPTTPGARHDSIRGRTFPAPTAEQRARRRVTHRPHTAIQTRHRGTCRGCQGAARLIDSSHARGRRIEGSRCAAHAEQQQRE